MEPSDALELPHTVPGAVHLEKPVILWIVQRVQQNHCATVVMIVFDNVSKMCLAQSHVYAPVGQIPDDTVVKGTANGKGKVLSAKGTGKGTRECESVGISAMFYQLCTIL